jgi:hypothetical protein
VDQAAFLEVQRRMAEEEARRGTHPQAQTSVPTGMDRLAAGLQSQGFQNFMQHPVTQGVTGTFDYLEQIPMRGLTALAARLRGDDETLAGIMSGGRYEPGMLTGNQWVDMGIGSLLSADNLIPGLGLVPAPRIGAAAGFMSDWSHVPGLDRARKYTPQTVPPPVRQGTTTATGRVSQQAIEAQRRISRRLAPRILRNPARLQELDAAIARGVAAQGPQWYTTTQMKDLFRNALGDNDAANELYNITILLTAATSPQTTVRDNIARALTLVDQVSAGRGYPEIKAFLEANPGWRSELFDRSLSAAMMNDAMVRQALETGELGGQKVSSFLTNYLDNLHAVTVDTHNLRALLYFGGMDFRTPAGRRQIAQFFDMPTSAADMAKYSEMSPYDFIALPYAKISSSSKPGGAAYTALEELNRTLAERYNLSPRDFQATLWTGAADITGVDSIIPFDQLFMDVVQQRAAVAGIEPEELVRRMASGQVNIADVVGEEYLTRVRNRLTAMAADEMTSDEVAPAQPDSFDREQWTPPTGMNDERLGEIARQLNQP